MENKKFLYGKFAIYTVAIPLGITLLLTVAFCLIEKNYYYLPYELDFLIDVTYNSLFYFLYIVLFFTLGILCVVSLKMKIGPIIITNCISAVCTFALFPFAAYFIRAIFLSATASEDVMSEYFFSDLLCGVENVARLGVGIVVVVAVNIFFTIKKIPTEPQKPYLAPKSAPQIAFMIFYLAWMLMAVLIFVFSEEHVVSSVLIEIAISVAGYFISVLGMVFAEKKLFKTE